MAGYCLKDRGQPWFALPYLFGGCLDQVFMDNAHAEHQRVSGGGPFKMKLLLQTTNLMLSVMEYSFASCRPLRLHVVQVLRFMLLSTYYQIHPKMVSPGAGRPVSFVLCQQYYDLVSDIDVDGDCTVYAIFDLLSHTGVLGLDEVRGFARRNHVFDTMSITEMKVSAKNTRDGNAPAADEDLAPNQRGGFQSSLDAWQRASVQQVRVRRHMAKLGTAPDDPARANLSDDGEEEMEEFDSDLPEHEDTYGNISFTLGSAPFRS